MTVAKTNEAHALLVTCFFTRKTAKTYHALVHGLPTPLPAGGDAPASAPAAVGPGQEGRKAGAGDGSKEGYVCGRVEGRVDGYPARSRWRTLETFGAAKRHPASLRAPVASLVQVPPTPIAPTHARTHTHTRQVMRQEQRRRSSILYLAHMARKPSIAPPESPGNVAQCLPAPEAAGPARLDCSEGKERAAHEDRQVAAVADFPYAALWEANAVAMADVEDDGMPPDQRACTVTHMEIAVSIDAVHHLPQADMMGKCDPYVTLSFFEQKFNTAVHRNCFEAQVC